MPFKGAIAQKSLKIKMSQIASLSTFLDAEFRADSEKRNYKVWKSIVNEIIDFINKPKLSPSQA